MYRAVEDKRIGHLASLAVAPCADPVSCGITAGMMVGQDLFQYWMQQVVNNRLKVYATQEAEGYVRAVWGKEGSCFDLKASIDWRYGEPQQLLASLKTYPNPHPFFCEDSVAGMIERCNLGLAGQYLNWLGSSMSEQLARDPTQGRFTNWFNQYGMQTITDAQVALQRGSAACAAGGPSAEPDSTTVKLPTSSTPVTTIAGFDFSSLLILGVLGLGGYLLLQRS